MTTFHADMMKKDFKLPFTVSFRKSRYIKDVLTSTHMVISFAASPYFTKPLPETVDLRPAQDFTLSCEAAAEPAAEYKWYIDGVLQRVFQSSYEIETADIGDTGIYQVSLNRAFWLAMAVCTHFIFFLLNQKVAF